MLIPPQYLLRNYPAGRQRSSPRAFGRPCLRHIRRFSCRASSDAVLAGSRCRVAGTTQRTHEAVALVRCRLRAGARSDPPEGKSTSRSVGPPARRPPVARWPCTEPWAGAGDPHTDRSAHRSRCRRAADRRPVTRRGAHRPLVTSRFNPRTTGHAAGDPPTTGRTAGDPSTTGHPVSHPPTTGHRCGPGPRLTSSRPSIARPGGSRDETTARRARRGRCGRPGRLPSPRADRGRATGAWRSAPGGRTRARDCSGPAGAVGGRRRRGVVGTVEARRDTRMDVGAPGS